MYVACNERSELHGCRSEQRLSISLCGLTDLGFVVVVMVRKMYEVRDLFKVAAVFLLVTMYDHRRSKSFSRQRWLSVYEEGRGAAMEVGVVGPIAAAKESVC